jgi:hypothetical protein
MPNQREDKFAIWEKLYRRPLTELERDEIKTNMLSFLDVLAEVEIVAQEKRLADLK